MVDNERYTLDEIVADDNGVYTYEGCPTNLIHYENGVCQTVRKNENNDYFINRRTGQKYTKEIVDRTAVFVLYRTYRRHSFHCGYSNIICRVKDLDGISQRYCLVINQWANEEEDTNFSLPCHGNAKTQNAKNTPFLRTEKNVLQSMKEDIKNGAKPQNVYQHAVCLSGGPFKSTTQSQQPRNQKQVVAC